MSTTREASQREIKAFANKWTSRVTAQCLPRLRKQYDHGASELDILVEVSGIVDEILKLANGEEPVTESYYQAFSTSLAESVKYEFRQASAVYLYNEANTKLRKGMKLPLRVTVTLK